MKKNKNSQIATMLIIVAGLVFTLISSIKIDQLALVVVSSFLIVIGVIGIILLEKD